MRVRRLLTSITLAATATWIGGSAAQSSPPTLTFRATVSGKTSDTGSFHRSESFGSSVPTLIGCGVLKHKVSKPYGLYTYIVRTVPLTFPGVKPKGPGVALAVYRYKPGSATSYTHLDVGGDFAINGHVYASHPYSTSNEMVTISSDGRSGSWIDPDAFRYYPAKSLKPVSGFRFKASWHCSTVFHFHD